MDTNLQITIVTDTFPNVLGFFLLFYPGITDYAYCLGDLDSYNWGKWSGKYLCTYQIKSTIEKRQRLVQRNQTAVSGSVIPVKT